MSNLNLVDKARDFAQKKHSKQKDDSGKPYFQAHLEVVVEILKLVTQEPEILAAGYLHDTLEDTTTTPEELERNFGVEVRELVQMVTHEGVKDEYGRYFPRLKTQEAIMIKFADRLSNLSRMETWDSKRKAQYLRKSKFWKTDPINEGIDLATRLMNHLSKTEGSCKCKGYHPNCVNCQHQLFVGALDNYLDFLEWEKRQDTK